MAGTSNHHQELSVTAPGEAFLSLCTSESSKTRSTKPCLPLTTHEQQSSQSKARGRRCGASPEQQQHPVLYELCSWIALRLKFTMKQRKLDLDFLLLSLCDQVKGKERCNQQLHTHFTHSISGHQLKHMQQRALNRRAESSTPALLVTISAISLKTQSRHCGPYAIKVMFFPQEKNHSLKRCLCTSSCQGTQVWQQSTSRYVSSVESHSSRLGQSRKVELSWPGILALRTWDRLSDQSLRTTSPRTLTT